MKANVVDKTVFNLITTVNGIADTGQCAFQIVLEAGAPGNAASFFFFFNARAGTSLR